MITPGSWSGWRWAGRRAHRHARHVSPQQRAAIRAHLDAQGPGLQHLHTRAALQKPPGTQLGQCWAGANKAWWVWFEFAPL